MFTEIYQLGFLTYKHRCKERTERGEPEIGVTLLINTTQAAIET